MSRQVDAVVGDRGGSRVDRFAEDENPEPRFAITAVAASCGIHVQTVRRYERFGLVEARAVDSGSRLYSAADIARIRRIRRLTDDLGVNLAGVAAVLHLRDQLVALQRELETLRSRIDESR